MVAKYLKESEACSETLRVVHDSDAEELVRDKAPKELLVLEDKDEDADAEVLGLSAAARQAIRMISHTLVAILLELLTAALRPHTGPSTYFQQQPCNLLNHRRFSELVQASAATKQIAQLTAQAPELGYVNSVAV